VRVVRPTALVADAADVLGAVRDDVVVVGAAAVEIVLARTRAVVTPTLDIDLVVTAEQAEAVVRHLEDERFRPSVRPHERGFTWVRDELSVQLVRSFHPFPRGPAAQLPENTAFAMAAEPGHRDLVAFEAEPERPRLTCVRPLCLVALKQAAFGRVRSVDARPVARDFHDVHLLLRHAEEQLAADVPSAGYEVKARARRAIQQLAAGGDATAAAARELLRTGEADTQRAAEDEVLRTAARCERRLFG
jgi:hypothetical protein